jgi:hypothetical protein
MNLAGTSRQPRAARHAPAGSRESLASRLDAVSWADVEERLDAAGCAILPNLFVAEDCDRLVRLCAEDALFRSRIVTGRHGFGRGEYKYFAYPLPRTVASLRESVYPRLVPIANRWHERPRMQSRPEVVALRQGDAVVFAVHARPVQGTRGAYRVNHRHGVSRLRRGRRYTLGVIFHDAQ